MKALIAALALLTGCVHNVVVGRPFNPADAKKLTFGTSTKADAEALFGPPHSCNLQGNGNTTCLWMHGVVNVYDVNASPTTQTMQLYFDRDGKMIEKPF